MDLIPKYIDTRGLTKALLSNAFGKKPVRRLKVLEKTRRKYGDLQFSDQYKMKTDRYYTKLGEFTDCGKRGQVEIDIDGARRYRPFFCGLRRICFECFNRYKKGILWTYENRLLAIAEVNAVHSIVFPVYTLHPEIRQLIGPGMNTNRAELLNEIINLAAGSFKQAIGVNSHRGRDITGFVSIVHPFSSASPFSPFLHIHFAWIPLRITKDGTIKKMKAWLDVDRARDLWQKAQEKFAKKHGFKLSGSETNVYFKYIPLKEKARLRHSIRYIFRSLLDDIFIAVRYLTEDLLEFIWFEDLGTAWKPHLAKWDVLQDALGNYMNFPVKMVRSYGFLRNLKKYSGVLNIKQAVESPDFVPVTTHSCEFSRTYARHYLEGSKKYVFALSVMARYDGKPWHYVPLSKVLGETSQGGGRHIWIRGP